MAIALSEAHRELADVARSFLEGAKVREAARATLDDKYDQLPPFWGQLAGLGWLGLHLPEEHGGSGFGLPELVVVLEELGRVVAPGPFLPTVAASAVVADRAGPEVAAMLLPGLADGSLPAGIGLGGSVAVAGALADGDAGVVLGGGTAELLVLAASDAVVVLPRNREGVEVVHSSNLDPTQRSARVRLRGVEVLDGEVFAGARKRALDLVRVLAAAEAAGGARACVEAATSYAKVRKQFGREIGTFGPVKHHCANMLIAAELAAAAVWDAARAAGDPEPFSLAAAIAAVVAVPAFLRNAELNIQVHGGIGFTWESECHVLFRRAASLSAQVEARSAAADATRLAGAGIRHDEGLHLPIEAEQVRAEIRPLVAEVAALAPEQRRTRLVATGLATPHWPRPWGRESSPLEQLVIEEEMERAGVQRPDYGITGWILLTLVQKGSPEQAGRWVQPTLEGSMVWCQLFSEPDAGSDAAGIRTRGERVDGGWLVNGQKVWTSDAQQCDRGLATIRTEPEAPKHAGITTMVIDMKAEGVDIRPLRDSTGGTIFNEVFFDNVFVADADVVGPVNGGWSVARTTLGNERVSIGVSGPGANVDLLALARDHGGRVPGAAVMVGELMAEKAAMRALNLRSAQRAVAGGEPGPEGNVTKLLVAEHAQRVASAALTLLGPSAVLAEGAASQVHADLLFTRCLTIAGGTSEITRNQIGERILELPRDPLVS